MRKLLVLLFAAAVCLGLASNGYSHCVEFLDPTYKKVFDADNDGCPDAADKCANTPKGVKVDKNGCPVDSDGDGVADYLDKCANTPKGAKVDKDGCTVVVVVDSDGDGVADTADKCANTPKEAKVDKDGCTVVVVVDSDDDGVADADDKCANTPKGKTVDDNGCPIVAPVDSDGDGVVDGADKCADTPKGVAVEKNGCPVDTDGDRVPDYLDKCADTPKGKLVDKDGCVTEQVSISLEIQFDSGKTVIKQKYHDDIKKVADFMSAYPETTAVIEGHSDNVGSEDSNVRLSTRRAESVRKYMIDKFGIASDRVTAKGFGPARPIADNATPEGRQKNRRIEAVIQATTKR